MISGNPIFVISWEKNMISFMAMGRFKLPQLSSIIYTHHLRPAAFL